MQLTIFALTVLSIGAAIAQETVKTHIVRVGNKNGSLTFSPNDMTAEEGDMVQFQFAPANHTVTQSTFDQPCQPLAMNSNLTGVYSGFMPVSANAEMAPTWTIMVKAKTPMWLYCSQGKHCQNGMTMVINAPAANKSRTLANYQALAKEATVNLPGNAVSDGTSGSTPSNSTSGSGSTSATTTTTAASTATGTDAAASSTATSVNNTGDASSMLDARGAMGMGGLVALGFALLV